MDNYMNNSIQYDNNNNIGFNQPISNIHPSTNIFNQPSFPQNNFGTQNGPENFNNLSNGLSNDLINANTLQGTNLDSNIDSNFKSNLNGSLNQEPELIKSLAGEIINGLKENNMSLYDNSSINSYRKHFDDIERFEKSNNNHNSNLSKSKSKNTYSKEKEGDKTKTKVVETLEDFIVGEKNLSSPKTYTEYAGWFFDECFNYKDFLILFILYFVLSQEMIKDFFAKYFTSLNPDSEGKVNIQGVIIYGLILTILYMVTKKLF